MHAAVSGRAVAAKAAASGAVVGAQAAVVARAAEDEVAARAAIAHAPGVAHAAADTTSKTVGDAGSVASDLRDQVAALAASDGAKAALADGRVVANDILQGGAIAGRAAWLANDGVEHGRTRAQGAAVVGQDAAEAARTVAADGAELAKDAAAKGKEVAAGLAAGTSGFWRGISGPKDPT